ncbi:universal stress protein [Halalkalibacter nanhaiisediminis]|uniref:Universal stress protein n=1 Tax=Halalkalibacter nanhaiisediminis TaxID=688079 RepID=A0A562QD14_9BACI|nr:universal stress protein [Halalkalibacter nanhaiisediminis]TWI54050.1 nucleotide-binding universal stress UspA family protein [Halalkalibacter nanhaiisediminis]
MFERIIVAADGSGQSLKAAEKAIELARVTGAHIYVVYAVDGTTSKADVLRTWNSLGITEKRNEKLTYIEEQAKINKISYEVKIVRGDPATSIVRFAKESRSDLIVIGSRGLNQLQQMVLGSVSHKVAKRATCPVLIIK